jgi:hypothetical protein
MGNPLTSILEQPSFRNSLLATPIVAIVSMNGKCPTFRQQILLSQASATNIARHSFTGDQSPKAIESGVWVDYVPD